MKVKSESEVAQSCTTPSNPMDCSLPGSSIHGIIQARVLEWGAIAFSHLCTGFQFMPHILSFSECCFSLVLWFLWCLQSQEVKISVQDMSVTIGTTHFIVNEMLLITCAIKKELNFWWKAHGTGGGSLLFFQANNHRKQELLLKPTTTLRIGIGYDSLPRNGRPNVRNVFTFKEAYSLDFLFF